RPYTAIFSRPRRLQDTRSRREPCFLGGGRDAITAASGRPAGAVFVDACRRAVVAGPESCQAGFFSRPIRPPGWSINEFPYDIPQRHLSLLVRIGRARALRHEPA